jgi:hypothetical protein
VPKLRHRRNYKSQLNGSMTVDDIFDMYAALLLNGFVPDTMLVHPMAWLMWVKDPVIREFAIQAGGGSFFAQFTGNPAVQGNPFYNFGGLGQGHGQTGQYTGGALTGGEVSAPEAGNFQRMQSGVNLGLSLSGANKLPARGPSQPRSWCWPSL